MSLLTVVTSLIITSIVIASELWEYIVIARGGGIPTEGVATESMDVMINRVIDGTALALAGGPYGARGPISTGRTTGTPVGLVVGEEDPTEAIAPPAAVAAIGRPAGATHGTVIRESIVLEEDIMGADENGTPLRCAAVAAVAATDGGDRTRSARRRVPSKNGVGNRQAIA